MTRAEAHGQGKRAAGLDPHRRGQRYCLPEKSPDFFCIFTFLPCRCSSLRLVKPVSRWRSVADQANPPYAQAAPSPAISSFSLDLDCPRGGISFEFSPGRGMRYRNAVASALSDGFAAFRTRIADEFGSQRGQRAERGEG